jgi:uncharacterized Tic20 family protein
MKLNRTQKENLNLFLSITFYFIMWVVLFLILPIEILKILAYLFIIVNSTILILLFIFLTKKSNL